MIQSQRSPSRHSTSQVAMPRKAVLTKKWIRALLLAFLPIFIGVSCSTNWLQIAPALPTNPVEPTTNPLTTLPETEVNFRVEVPANTPVEDTVFLSLMDEVTGLALNAENYPMQVEEAEAGAPRYYSLSMALPMGSAVKYRYERQSQTAIVAEHVSDGRPVRYRLYYVGGPGTVEDVISRWTDTPFTAAKGRINGLVTDRDSGQPIPNLLVTAGGAQTFTTSDGSFLLEGLPPGVHNLVIYAMDGSYRTFQQGARVASESMTPALVQVTAAPSVNIVFVVNLPADTPPVVPVRLAGNLYQLGNSFANLTGGISALAANMPVLGTLPDGRYTLTVTLPAGADLRYKYTLGDGFWNAEHTSSGEFRLRQLVVPEQNTMVEDIVDTWHSSSHGTVTFDVNVPDNTPPGDTVSLQFNPLFGWTEPVPMWNLGGNRWAYVLFSPLNVPGLSYRYCRNGQCGRADAANTAGTQAAGHPVTPGDQPQTIKEQVDSWAWLNTANETVVDVAAEVAPRSTDFIAGIEFQAVYHPSWKALLPAVLNELRSLGANWLVLSPTWTFTRNAPPVLEPVTGQDALWFDLMNAVEGARKQGLSVAIHPQPYFNGRVDEWWQDAQRDFSWWLVWFDQYHTFALHHADLATRTGAPALVLGGDWVMPALPGGTLADGSPSAVPADAETRWRNLITEIRSRYNGKIFWAMPLWGVANPPAFLDAVDQIYLEWDAPLSDQAYGSQIDLENEAARLLDGSVLPFQAVVNKPLILGVSSPSTGGATFCSSASQAGCIATQSLGAPGAEISGLQVDLQRQTDTYNALLNVVNLRTWIGGLVSQGYDPGVALQDLTASVHGKPAEEVLRYWFPRLAANPGP